MNGTDRCDVCLDEKVQGVCVNCFIDNFHIRRYQLRKAMRRIGNTMAMVGSAVIKNLDNLNEKQEEFSEDNE